MKVFVVVPTIRNLSFLSEWGKQFSSSTLIIVEDHEKKEIKPPCSVFKDIFHYAWDDIRSEFGSNEWIFPRRNAGIRSYGFWKAYEKGADVIITLDDDCYPAESEFVQKHLSNLAWRAPEFWSPTFPHPSYMYTRGFPYSVRNKKRVVISHGLWSNKMDMDAKTQLAIGEVNIPAYPPIRQPVPAGHYFPMSSMNLAFTRDMVPLMYFPLMGTNPDGKPWGYDRYDDIWAGVFAKKIIDHLGLAAVNGSPFVEHRKASDPQVNLRKERKGMKTSETLWQVVDRLQLRANTPVRCYRELALGLQKLNQDYFKDLSNAMLTWMQLFERPVL